MGKIEKSRYTGELKEIIGKEERVYERGAMKRTKDELEICARFRMGSETRKSKFWRREEERRRKLCEEEAESQVMQRCR